VNILHEKIAKLRCSEKNSIFQ